jgi:hypothetical protein
MGMDTDHREECEEWVKSLKNIHKRNGCDGEQPREGKMRLPRKLNRTETKYWGRDSFSKNSALLPDNCDMLVDFV